jgi:hypothetical protein
LPGLSGQQPGQLIEQVGRVQAVEEIDVEPRHRLWSAAGLDQVVDQRRFTIAAHAGEDQRPGRGSLPQAVEGRNLFNPVGEMFQSGHRLNST